MSRVGRKIIVLSQGVQVTVKEGIVSVKGPKGHLHFTLPALIQVKVEKETLLVTRDNEESAAKSRHGLVRNLIQNMVSGVTELLKQIHTTMYDRAKTRMMQQWHQGEKIVDFGPKLEAEQGWYQTGWCGSADCEAKVKEYKATVRCLLKEKRHDSCFACSGQSRVDVLVAKAY